MRPRQLSWTACRGRRGPLAALQSDLDGVAEPFADPRMAAVITSTMQKPAGKISHQ